MLVLSRHRDESICIGSDIQVTVVDIRGDKVRLGISAPKEVPVDRVEIRQAKEREGVKSDANGVRLHGDSERVVGGETEKTKRAAGESVG